jgi:hypothetical protein
MARRSGSMSGEWKRSKVSYSGTGNRKGRLTRKATPKPPRHSSTLPRALALGVNQIVFNSV